MINHFIIRIWLNDKVFILQVVCTYANCEEMGSALKYGNCFNDLNRSINSLVELTPVLKEVYSNLFQIQDFIISLTFSFHVCIITKILIILEWNLMVFYYFNLELQHLESSSD